MVLPAMVSSPKVLTEACTKILAKQNMAPCTAEGTPILSIPAIYLPEICTLFTDNLNRSSLYSRLMTNTAEIILDIPVEMETPATPR